MDEHTGRTGADEHGSGSADTPERGGPSEGARASGSGAVTGSGYGVEHAEGATTRPSRSEGHASDRNASEIEPDRAVRAGYPPDSGPEQHVITVRQAMWRSAPMRFGLLLVLVLGAVVGGIWLAVEGQKPWVWVVAVGGVMALVALLAWKVQTLTRALKISNKRTVYKRGLLNTSTSEVMHDNIRNVRVNQELWERIWNVGTVGISSAGSDGIEIEMRRVPNPGKVREIIDLYRPLG